MIKKLQALKAKKGFTLVELIVVIAIIGVLAAILVPTMLGYVTSSRVTSANSTAASIKNTVNNFITDMDTKGYTFDRAGAHTCKVTYDATKGVLVDFDADAFKNLNTGDEAKIEATLAKKLADDFGFTNVWAIVYIKNGKPVGCAYSPDGIAGPTGAANATGHTAGAFDIQAFDNPKSFDGWGDTDGVLAEADGVAGSGTIYGTAPTLTKALENATQDPPKEEG